MPPAPRPPIHIVHLVNRFAAGGLENVVVQLINHLPADQFCHTVVAITEADNAFAARITQPDVAVISLHKGPGQPFKLYPKMFRLLRRLRPAVLHTCNLAAMEFAPVAAAAGVPLRVHVEHGWDVADLGGGNAHYNWLRKAYKPFVHQFVAVAQPLFDYLHHTVGVAPARLQLIPNGVDTAQFRPRRPGDTPPPDWPFTPGVDWVIGYVGRLVAVKNPLLLVDAFIALAQSGVPGAQHLRLAMVGTGDLAAPIHARLQTAGVAQRAWLPGVRADVAHIFRAIDCFVLPSLFEATSCTLQEAMASGLPIVATDVGGNAALLQNGRCGGLVPSGNTPALTQAIAQVWQTPKTLPNPADNRALIEQTYSLEAVLQKYSRLFGGH